jgi:hypothetical protein
MTKRVLLIAEDGTAEVGGVRIKVVRADDLYAAIESLGAFVSDEGWGQNDMDNMDNLAAAIDLSGLPILERRTQTEYQRYNGNEHYECGLTDGWNEALDAMGVK